MDPEEAMKTMIDNLHKNTGKTLEEWIVILQAEKLVKHGEMIKFLKTEHGLTHGFANMIAHKSRGSDAGSVDDKDSLIEAQYKSKEHFSPLYEQLMAKILTFGKDVEIAPKKAYVSLRRKKQFAILQPTTKTRFEISLNIKDQESFGCLEAITKANAMCSHIIKLSGTEDLNEEVFDWIKKAYDHAG
jgi:predicted transport protein